MPVAGPPSDNVLLPATTVEDPESRGLPERSPKIVHLRDESRNLNVDSHRIFEISLLFNGKPHKEMEVEGARVNSEGFGENYRCMLIPRRISFLPERTRAHKYIK